MLGPPANLPDKVLGTGSVFIFMQPIQNMTRMLIFATHCCTSDDTMRTTPGAREAACQLPPSESRGALLGVMVVEFASAIGIHTFCKLLYRSHRSPSAIVMP